MAARVRVQGRWRGSLSILGATSGAARGGGEGTCTGAVTWPWEFGVPVAVVRIFMQLCDDRLCATR